MHQTNVFKVRYTSGILVILRYLPLAGIFAAITLAAIYVDSSREFLTESPKESPKIIVLVFSVLFLIVCAEVLITFCKIAMGVPALIIENDVIKGWNMWIPRKIRRHELAGVERNGNYLEIHRIQILPDSDNVLFKFARLFSVSIPTKIIVPLKAVDQSEMRIRNTLEEFGFLGKYIYKNR